MNQDRKFWLKLSVALAGLLLPPASLLGTLHWTMSLPYQTKLYIWWAHIVVFAVFVCWFWHLAVVRFRFSNDTDSTQDAQLNL